MVKLRPPKTKRDWVALLAGAAFAIGSGASLTRGALSLTWPKVNGAITYSTAKNRTRSYTIDIRYRYSAGGQTHDGNRYRFESFMARTRSSDVDLAQARYPVGERVLVAVNPSDAGDSVLLPGIDAQGFLWLGFGLLLMLGGLTDLRTKDEVSAPPSIPALSPAPRYRAAKVLGVVGGSLLLFGSFQLYKGWSSLSWPTVEGRILYSSWRGGNSYQTLLWYEYYVAQQRYLAQNYRNGGNGTPFREVARAARKRYPVGRSVRVFYNPSDPADALLEPGVWYGNFVLPGIGVIVLALALLAKKYSEVVARQRTIQELQS
jgi:hypothetical protein